MDTLSSTHPITPSTSPHAEPQFTLFPLLPRELRLQIYDTILSLPFLAPSFLTTPPTTTHRRILKISFSPSTNTYISATAPPILLHLCHESRIYTQDHHSYMYTPLLLGPSAKTPSAFSTRIPISYQNDTLYLSSLHPLLSTHLHEILFHISTSPSRNSIQSLAIDLRVWAELCDNGFLGILARMKRLEEVLLVVEFGRVGCFRGRLGWLDVPRWRGDLFWLAERAQARVMEERRKVFRWREKKKGEEEVVSKDVSVRAIILTRGGEQA